MNAHLSHRVLVVEDDRKISDLLLNYLRASGYEAEAAYDGRDALRQIEQTAPDAVILDWMLPGMDGISVCKAVRAFSDVPILMLTARVDEVDRLLGLDTGADDYVCKPFAPREVIARPEHTEAARLLWLAEERRSAMTVAQVGTAHDGPKATGTQ